MPTVIEQGIHLHLVADLAKLHLLVRNLKNHRPLTVPFPFAKSASVRVAGAGIDHFPLAVWFVVGPLPGVGVAVGKGHGAVAGFETGGEGAGVGVTSEGDSGARAMGPAGPEGA